MDIPQHIINWGLFAFSGMIGWFGNTLTSNMKELSSKVHAVELLVAEKYATSQDIRDLRNEMLEERKELSAKLRFIVELLEHKMDKNGAS